MKDGVEMDLVERVVASTHRLQRVLALEKGMFNAAVGFDIGPDEFKRAWGDLTRNNDLQNMQRYNSEHSEDADPELQTTAKPRHHAPKCRLKLPKPRLRRPRAT